MEAAATKTMDSKTVDINKHTSNTCEFKTFKKTKENNYQLTETELSKFTAFCYFLKTFVTTEGSRICPFF